MSDYNQYSNNLFVKGLKYKIRVPVFNVSFVDTPADKPLKIRMSLAKKNDQNPEHTTVAEYTFPGILPGCANGKHRHRAEFEWLPYVEWVKVNGMDFKDFIEQEVDGQTQPIPAEVEVKYGGEYLMTDAAIIGYALKAESASKDVTEISDADIGLVFVKEHFAMFPDEDHKLHFRINPNDLANGVGFLLQVYGQEYPLTDIIYGSAGSESVHNSSSGGCSARLGVMAGAAVLGLALVVRKR